MCRPGMRQTTRLPTLAKGLKLGVDGFYPGAVDVSDKVAHLRTKLGPEEGSRFRELGQTERGSNERSHSFGSPWDRQSLK